MRDVNLKIPDIKVFRSLTRLLGKLDLETCRTFHPPPPHPWQNSSSYTPYTYGLGLKEAKDLVERTFNYQHIPNSALYELKVGNELHQIKRTRQLMDMLNKLGLQTPDSGLQVCRKFVTRRRR